MLIFPDIGLVAYTFIFLDCIPSYTVKIDKHNKKNMFPQNGPTTNYGSGVEPRGSAP